ncbi:hypothetical protein [Actinokineospora iranica]|uniref:Phage integrase family protein n=1 Tax=Actinokineospora iranica TaxID=1271860 RepID=A0A1G6P0T2_9PSEU|nr:hypothetical protein [Actinokineospora iranica]SDC73608.1 hypothetical protein SAMN05216174_10451 [Actinokineospora iranica]
MLDSQRGHLRAGTFTSLQSLFRFAHRHRLVFTDPTRRLHVGRAPERTSLPMIDDQIVAVNRAVVTPMQRLVVALVVVHAARASTIRRLTLDDIDLSRRRLRINGAAQPMPELVHRLIREWLTERRCRWPHTLNRHVLISRDSAAGTAPVSDYYLSYYLAMQDVPLGRLRADRVLHEGLAVNADPLHLAAASGLSSQTAIDYAAVARDLMAKPIEDAPRAWITDSSSLSPVEASRCARRFTANSTRFAAS